MVCTWTVNNDTGIISICFYVLLDIQLHKLPFYGIALIFHLSDNYGTG
jgi:hypothetical protein